MGKLSLLSLVCVLAIGLLLVAVGQAVATDIPVTNHSFESPTTTSEYWYPDGYGMPGWGFYDRYGLGLNTHCVVSASHANRLPSGAPDGYQVGAAREGYFRQIMTGYTLEGNTSYTLSGYLGIDTWFPYYGLQPRGVKFGLWGYDSPYDVELVSRSFPYGTWSYGTMTPVTMRVDISENSPLVGWTLMPGLDQTTANSITEIDDVHIDATSPVDWVGNNVGVTDDTWVPEPWTVLNLVSSSPVQVSCWGRQYTFSAAGVSSVVSQSSELLASPMVWDVHVSSPDHQVVWTSNTPSVTSQANGAIEFTSSQTGDVFGLTLTCHGRIEFDGFVKLDFSITATSATTLNQVIVDIPFNSTYATLMHRFGWDGTTNWNSRAVPGTQWDSIFRPWVWIGNEDKGMQWLCESDKNWKPASASSAIQIVPNGGTTTLRLNLVGQSTSLPSATPREYTFLLEASPVKPMPSYKYTRHYTSVGGCSDIINNADYMQSKGVNSVSTFTWTDWIGYPYVSSEGHDTVLHNATQTAHNHGMMMGIYESLLMSSATPEYVGYIDECKVPGGWQQAGYCGDTAYAVCPNSVWSDFMVKGIDDTIRHFGLEGIYSDSMECVGFCSGTLHGCGYVGDDSQVHGTVPIIATREFNKRIYRVLEVYGNEQSKQMMFVGHNSCYIMLPALGFCTAYLDAEHLTNITRPFTIPLDTFRAELMGRNFGIPCQNLSYYDQTGKGLTEEEMLAMCLLHDADEPWEYELMSPVWAAWDNFGMSDAQFLPYWQAWGWQAPTDVKVSAYSKPNSDQMLVVGVNTGTQSAQGNLGVNGHIGSATNIFTGNPATVQDGMISDTFPVLEARMYRVTLDETAPTGSISINSGATYCNSTSVTLTLSATDNSSGVSQMRFSNDGSSWSSWETYATSKAWTLTSGDGTKTAYVQYKDVAGNVSSNYTDTIILDATAPTSGTASPPASVTTSTISVSYSGASDSGSGLKQVELWYKEQTPITVENWSFEEPETDAEYWYPDGIGDMPGWGYWDRYGLGLSTRCVVNASHANRLPSGAPNGAQVGAAREGFFRQILSGQTVQAGASYTLTAYLGIDTWFPTYGLVPRGTKFALYAYQYGQNDVELVSRTFPQGYWTQGTMAPVVMSVDIPSNSPYAGWTLMIGIDQTTANSIVEIDDVHLYVTSDTWINSGLTKTAASDTFTFTPPSGSGRYYFDLVAEDNIGNRSSAASGSGDGVTIFKLWFSDGFESNNFTAGGWTNSGCTIQSTYKYSGTYAAMFNSSDSITKSYSTSGKSDIKLEYARYTRQMESDDHFICEWYNGSAWTTLEDLTGNSSWAVKQFILPAGAENNASFQIRFRTSHNGSTDYAYLDDVKIIGI
ncbi:MAG: glycoside hydrolase domain-containing protein [Armatimonadota bacterium]